MSTAKQDVTFLLNKLPDNCSVEDINTTCTSSTKFAGGSKMPASTARYRKKKLRLALANGSQSKLVAVASKCRIAYRIQEDEVIVAAVIHGRRNLQWLFGKDKAAYIPS